jgi:uncharacterized membrane protein (UPF0127 family)
MRTHVLAGFFLLCIALPACAAQPAADFQPEQLRGFERTDLTIERRGGRDTFRVWLATTPAEQQQGLMWIRRLPANQGMLFLLDAPRPMDMWMKNTYVPLDMLFFDATGRISHIRARTEPLSEEYISSGGEVAGVLELLAGEASRRGIREGDRILLPPVRSR